MVRTRSSQEAIGGPWNVLKTKNDEDASKYRLGVVGAIVREDRSEKMNEILEDERRWICTELRYCHIPSMFAFSSTQNGYAVLVDNQGDFVFEQ